jgi:peptidoglycan/LPS O-acetylase OafA/YrhL
MTASNRLSYIPGLDGIRALAVLAVHFHHAELPWVLGGFLGVETFFVLSGFLITSLLITEWRSTNQIDLKHFWLRRARRLLSAVWLLLLALPVLANLFARDA